MTKSIYKRILLKLSGEALMGDDAFGVNPDTINKIVNEVWYNNKLNVIEDLPSDISTECIQKILDLDGSMDSKDWIFWSNCFKNQYKSIGSKID